MPTHILDATAVLALMGREAGCERVRELVRSGGAGLSTAARAGVPAVTADRAWAGLPGIAVEVIPRQDDPPGS